MWAQLITARLKPGREGDLSKLSKHLQAAEQPNSGLMEALMMVDQKDPGRVYMVVVFESEEKARARENDQRRQAGPEHHAAHELMEEIFDGAPEFVDLTVIEEWTP